MISTADFKTGLTILYDNNLFQIIDFQHVKPGKGAAFVTSRLRNLRTGATIDYTFRAGEKMEQANIEKIKKVLAYQPKVNLKQGLEKTLDGYKNKL